MTNIDFDDLVAIRPDPVRLDPEWSVRTLESILRAPEPSAAERRHTHREHRARRSRRRWAVAVAGAVVVALAVVLVGGMWPGFPHGTQRATPGESGGEAACPSCAEDAAPNTESTAPNTESSAPNAENAAPGTDSLAALLQSSGGTADFTVHDSPEQLGRDAALTVIGTIQSVADGRVFGVGPTRKTEPNFLSVVFTVHVEKVLAGDAALIHDGLVYVELPRTQAYPVSDFADALPPGQRAILFLSDDSDADRGLPLIEPAPSVPARAPVLAPYEEGFLLADPVSGRLIGAREPLDQLPADWQRGDESIASFVAAHFAAR